MYFQGPSSLMFSLRRLGALECIGDIDVEQGHSTRLIHATDS